MWAAMASASRMLRTRARCRRRSPSSTTWRRSRRAPVARAAALERKAGTRRRGSPTIAAMHDDRPRATIPSELQVVEAVGDGGRPRATTRERRAPGQDVTAARTPRASRGTTASTSVTKMRSRLRRDVQVDGPRRPKRRDSSRPAICENRPTRHIAASRPISTIWVGREVLAQRVAVGVGDRRGGRSRTSGVKSSAATSASVKPVTVARCRAGRSGPR